MDEIFHHSSLNLYFPGCTGHVGVTFSSSGGIDASQIIIHVCSGGENAAPSLCHPICFQWHLVCSTPGFAGWTGKVKHGFPYRGYLQWRKTKSLRIQWILILQMVQDEKWGRGSSYSVGFFSSHCFQNVSHICLEQLEGDLLGARGLGSVWVVLSFNT